jgi:hypothetical protein
MTGARSKGWQGVHLAVGLGNSIIALSNNIFFITFVCNIELRSFN